MGGRTDCQPSLAWSAELVAQSILSWVSIVISIPDGDLRHVPVGQPFGHQPAQPGEVLLALRLVVDPLALVRAAGVVGDQNRVVDPRARLT